MAVVAQGAGLQDAGVADLVHRPAKRRFVLYGGEIRGEQPVFAGVRLFAQAVLRVVKGAEALRNVVFLGQRNQYPARHVLEFVAHHVAAAAELLERRGIVVGRHDMLVAHGKCRSVGCRVERYGPCPQQAGLLREHQPQLTASYDTDRHLLHGVQSSAFSTSAVCPARKAS